jgi:hypothetical protein
MNSSVPFFLNDKDYVEVSTHPKSSASSVIEAALTSHFRVLEEEHREPTLVNDKHLYKLWVWSNGAVDDDFPPLDAKTVVSTMGLTTFALQKIPPKQKQKLQNSPNGPQPRSSQTNSPTPRPSQTSQPPRPSQSQARPPSQSQARPPAQSQARPPSPRQARPSQSQATPSPTQPPRSSPSQRPSHGQRPSAIRLLGRDGESVRRSSSGHDLVPQVALPGDKPAKRGSSESRGEGRKAGGIVEEEEPTEGMVRNSRKPAKTGLHERLESETEIEMGKRSIEEDQVGEDLRNLQSPSVRWFCCWR